MLAFSEIDTIKLLFIIIGGINGIFLLCKNLLTVDQYAFAPSLGSFNLFPREQRYFFLASFMRLAL